MPGHGSSSSARRSPLTATSATKKRTYDYTNLLPSLNATYNFNRKSLLRLAYGMTVNRPEFRELSPSTYEDFDMYSLVMGNPPT